MNTEDVWATALAKARLKTFAILLGRLHGIFDFDIGVKGLKIFDERANDGI